MWDTFGELFGSVIAAKILLYIENYGEGHPSGIAKTFGIDRGNTYRQTLRLESAGILTGRTVGNMRLFTINPRCPFKEELGALLASLLSQVSEKDTEKYFRQRRRPRRTGKELR